LLVDDDGNVTRPTLQPLSGLYHIWFDPTVTAQYYPLVHTVFWIEHRLWGDSHLGYHLVTLLWHIVSVVLVYFIVERLKLTGALLAAAVFALHPVMVESVAWMCEQKNTLSTAFYLSALLTYLAFNASRRRSQYFLALGLFALALLTKTITVTLPAVLLVIFWWQRGRVEWRRDVVPLLPFFALGAASGLMTVWVEHTYFHGEEADFTLSLAQRFLLASRAICFYLGKLVWPAHLMFTYPRWTIDPSQAWQWVFPVAVLATTIALWVIRKLWRAPLAAWLIYCGTLLPAIGIANVYMFVITYVADHMQYLASLAMIVPVSVAVARCVERQSQSVRWAGTALCILLVAVLAVLSRQQSHLYGDVFKFYEAVLADNPDSWLAHNNLGKEYANNGKPQEAIKHVRAALSIRANFEMAHRNLGGLLSDNGQFSEAIKEYQAALALEPNDPEARNGLGFTLNQMGRPAEAIESLRHAIRLQPDYAEAHNNLGIALGRTGKTEEAIEEFRRALELNKNLATAHNNWGIVLSSTGKNLQAIEHFREALQLNSNDANSNFNLAAVLAETGKNEEAISHFEQAIRVRPDFVEAHFELAETLRKMDRTQPAIEHYRTVLRHKPDFINAYANLAKALAVAGNSDEAISVAQQGIEANRSAGQQAVAQEIEQWLKQYRTELQRSADAVSSGSTPQAPKPARSQ
jgi:tetratricopeptide (TPR) repeat protein